MGDADDRRGSVSRATALYRARTARCYLGSGPTAEPHHGTYADCPSAWIRLVTNLRRRWGGDVISNWTVHLVDLARAGCCPRTSLIDPDPTGGATTMSSLSIRLIKAAFVYLALGITLGAAFALDRSLGAVLRPLHAELNLWGWVTLLIYGFAYHMFPRFSGRPLRQPAIATAQSWLAISGVALVSLGLLGSLNALPAAQMLLVAGGVIQISAAMIFTWLIGSLLARR